MDDPALQRLVEDLASGACAPDDALRQLRRLPFADLGFARVDHHRALRQRMPEAVYGPGKTPAQVAAIVRELLDGSGGPVILTRANPDQVEAAQDAAAAGGHAAGKIGGSPGPAGSTGLATGTAPGATSGPDTPGATAASAATATGPGALVTWRPAPGRPGTVVVITAGTADLPVAEECVGVLEALGLPPTLLTDCGVAGLHRVLAHIDEVCEADAVVVVAGMDGALASVVGGLAAAPVVAVPSSVGYGAGLEGVTALLSMLASCAAGVTVVGIDNGFGAAYAVSRLLP